MCSRKVFFLSLIERVRLLILSRRLMLLLMGAHDLSEGLWELWGALNTSSLEVDQRGVPVRVVELAKPKLVQVLVALLMNVVNFGVNNLNALPIR
jgi:hypothetical protein